MRTIVVNALMWCVLVAGLAFAAQPTKHPPNGMVVCDAVDPLQCLTVGPHGAITVFLNAHPDAWWTSQTSVLSSVGIVPNSRRDGFFTYIVSMQCWRPDADSTVAYSITLNDEATSKIAMPSPTKQATGGVHDVTFSPPLRVGTVGGALTLSTSAVLAPTDAAQCNVQGFFRQ